MDFLIMLETDDYARQRLNNDQIQDIINKIESCWDPLFGSPVSKTVNVEVISTVNNIAFNVLSNIIPFPFNFSMDMDFKTAAAYCHDHGCEFELEDMNRPMMFATYYIKEPVSEA